MAHRVFFTRDEDPDEANRLTYRERLMAVARGTGQTEAEGLLRAYFDHIKSRLGTYGPGKYINLAVFDHVFHERAERPALAALNWKDWRGKKPEISFPFETPAVVETSYIPAASAAADRPKRRRIPSQELHIGRQAEVIDLNEVLAEVFEAMQDLYSIQSLTECIAFGLKLAASKIPCEAAVGLAASPGAEHMSCVAAIGPEAQQLMGRKVPLQGTLAGLACQQGVTVAVSDAMNDPRVAADIDRLTSTETRSVLCAPLVFEGRTFGVAELINRQVRDSWRQGEINILSYVTNHLSEYIAQSLPASELDDEDDMDGAPTTQRPNGKRPG